MIQPELERIINIYTRRMRSRRPPKKQTIIILTDGVWSGMSIETTVDVYIKTAFHMLRDLHRDLGLLDPGQDPNRLSVIRPVTIQFIRFGNDPIGTERLRRLDDDLKMDGYP
jgi:hypothetical protein